MRPVLLQARSETRTLRTPAGLTSVASVVLAFCLFNAPFWWAARENFLSRAVFNLDLLLPLLIARRRPVVGLLVLLPLWALDLAVSESLAWHFHSPVEFIRSIEFLDSSGAVGFIAHSRWIALALPFAVAAGAAVSLSHRCRFGWRSVLGVALAVAAADTLNGSSFAWNCSVRLVSANIAGTAVKSTIQSALAAPKAEALRPILSARPEDRSATAKFDVAGWARLHPAGSIVVVLVESMGVHADPAMRAWLARQLGGTALAERFDIREADIAFDGGTTYGELRELCGLTGSYRAMTAELGGRCLPAQLAAHGWKTLGLHGFSRRMFLREQWWPEVGIERSEFAEDVEGRPGMTSCGGAFPGICDDAMVREAVGFAQRPGHFAYLVTLNSHLPIEADVAFADTPAPCASAAVGPDVCAHAAVLSRVLSAVRRELLAAPVAPLVVVVGDHAPPFSATAVRRQFDPLHVPAFVLVPKS